MKEMRTLSRRVKSLRNQQGLTKVELARRAGVSVSTIRNIEKSGETLYNPHLGTLAFVADGLGVKVGELTNLPLTITQALDKVTHEGYVVIY